MVYLQTTLRDVQSNNVHLATANVFNHGLPFMTNQNLCMCDDEMCFFGWVCGLIWCHQLISSISTVTSMGPGRVLLALKWYSKTWQWCQTDKCSVDLFSNQTMKTMWSFNHTQANPRSASNGILTDEFFEWSSVHALDSSARNCTHLIQTCP